MDAQRQQPIREAADAVGQVPVQHAHDGIRVQHRPVDADVVHLRDEHLGRMRQVGEVRGQVLLGVLGAVQRPDEAAVAARAEPDIAQARERAVGRIGQRGVVARRPVAKPPHRLVVVRHLALEVAEVLAGGRETARFGERRKAVGVAIDDHRRSRARIR